MKMITIIFDKEDFTKLLNREVIGLIGFSNDENSIGVIVEDEHGTEEQPYPQRGVKIGE
jgi:hypothetical protein